MHPRFPTGMATFEHTNLGLFDCQKRFYLDGKADFFYKYGAATTRIPTVEIFLKFPAQYVGFWAKMQHPPSVSLFSQVRCENPPELNCTSEKKLSYCNIIKYVFYCTFIIVMRTRSMSLFIVVVYVVRINKAHTALLVGL